MSLKSERLPNLVLIQCHCLFRRTIYMTKHWYVPVNDRHDLFRCNFSLDSLVYLRWKQHQCWYCGGALTVGRIEVRDVLLLLVCLKCRIKDWIGKDVLTKI